MTSPVPQPFRLRLALAIAVIALAAWPPATRAALTLMHGVVDGDAALLWIQTTTPSAVEVSWQPARGSASRTQHVQTRAADENATVVRLTGVEPGDPVRYRVRAGSDTREGELRVPPVGTAEDPPTLTIAIGSCFFLDDDAAAAAASAPYGGGYGIFDAIAEKRPDLMLWLGDNLYFQRGDFYDPPSLAARHRRQRSLPALQRLLTATSHLAIWDDHDYGPNDSDATYRLKRETLRLFTRYWANPRYGLPDTPGVFGRVRLADVELFLLDDRYHRSPNRAPDGPDKTMFGAAQRAWLVQGLRESQASVKLVASGSQFWNRASRFEGLHQFPTEQKALADAIEATRADGLVFLSGDRHFGELLRVARPDSYPLLEFTSSPLTSRPVPRVDARELANPDVVPGTLVSQRQFGLIRIHGPVGDRRLTLSSHDERGATLWAEEIPLASLAHLRAAP